MLLRRGWRTPWTTTSGWSHRWCWPRCNDAQKTGSERRCRHCLVDVCGKAKLPTCLGGLGLWAQLGFAAQATYWSAVELHKAIMSNMCSSLHSQHSERHLEETLALAAKTALLTNGVAVDDHAVVQLECDARKVLESSPCAGDKEAAEVIRPAPVQATDHVPPKSVARDMPYAKAAIEDLVCHRGGASCQAPW